jgi:hypothetical protein
MGTWGPGLYSCDLASDLRDDFREIVRAPWDAERLIAYLTQRYPTAADPKNEEYPDFWLVVADQMWSYGIAHAATLERARELIRSGRDSNLKRALGLVASDLRKRERQLAELLARWETPNPKPKARKVLAKPEPFLLPQGGCLTWPTTKGRARNPYVGPSQSDQYYALYNWSPDGWGALVVLKRFHRHEMFARYLGAVVDAGGQHKPGIDDFKASAIRVEDTSTGRGPLVALFFAPKSHLANMAIEVVGAIDVDEAAVTRDLPAVEAMHDVNLGDLVSAWANQRFAASIPLSPYLRGS